MASQVNATGEKRLSFEPAQTKNPDEAAVQLQMTGRTEDAMSLSSIWFKKVKQYQTLARCTIIAHQADMA